MKAAIPVNGENIESGICISFGRAPFYMIYDTETGSTDFVINKAADSQGGAGIKAAQLIADSGAKAVLTPRCGENAAQVLRPAGIKIFKTSGDSIRDNIDLYLKNSLPLLNDIHPGFHGHGG